MVLWTLFARPVEVIAREGTVVWAREGAPVALSTRHCAQEIVEAIIVALAPACPDRAMAGWARRFRIAIKGEDPRTHRGFIWHLFHARPGGGASSGGDGWPNAGEWHSAGGIKFASVEVAEMRFPQHFAHHEFRIGSGGAGAHRGGDGVDLGLVPRIEKAAVANTAGDGARHGARGIPGGSDGKPHHYELRKRNGSVRVLKTKEAGVVVEPGTTVATSALLTLGGARAGLLATEGDRDILEMREGLKDDRYDLRLPHSAQRIAQGFPFGISRCTPEHQGIRTHLDHCRERSCRTARGLLSLQPRQRLVEAGYRGPVLIIHSSGGATRGEHRRGPGSHRLRHGRHLDRHLAAARWRTTLDQCARPRGRTHRAAMSARRRRSSARRRRAWRPGIAARSSCAARPTCATGSRSTRSTCRSTAWRGMRLICRDR